MLINYLCLRLIDRLANTGRLTCSRSFWSRSATHSPIFLTFPGAVILSFDHGALRRVKLEETQQFQITKGVLDHPESYWRHLGAEGE